MRKKLALYFRKCPTLLGVLAATAVVMSAVAVGTASASPGTCGKDESGNWKCWWQKENQQPGEKNWFEAETTLRPWYAAAVNGGNTGGANVTAKCVHVKRSSNGEETQVACGVGFQSGGIGENWRPGWLFTRHGASGPRWILGIGWH